MGNEESKGHKLGGAPSSNSSTASSNRGGPAPSTAMSYAGLPVSPDSDLQRALQISAAEARAGSAAERGKPKITDEQRLAADEAERMRQKEIKTFVNQGSREWESDADKAARLAAANALESRLNSKAGQGKLPGQQAVVSAKAEKSFDLAFAVQEKKFQQFAAQRDEVFGSERKAAPHSPSNVLVSPAALGYSSSDDVSMWAPIPSLESALQLIHSKNAADVSASSLQTIRTVLENIIKAATPDEVSKFRRIKYSSKIVQKNISQVVGALECVQAIGFQLTEFPAGTESEAYLILPESISACEIRQALHWLSM